MKFTPEVVAALQVLRDNATNDFERHRLDVLERDLTAPPAVEVIDDKHQRFNGVTFNKDKTGHYRATFHLHREVCFYYTGQQGQKGYHVHHINNNPDDNNIDNLQYLTITEHIRLHKGKGTPAAHRKQNAEISCAHCGKIFTAKESHRKYCSEDCQRQHEYKEYICNYCGKVFYSRHKGQRYCSISCAQKSRFRSQT